MNGLIRASLRNPYAVTVTVFTILVLGILCLTQIPFDILPVFKSPAVQVLTFYGGMPARGIEKDITNRMERWTGQSNGIRLQESRSIVGASIVRNYFHDDVDPNGALTQVNSLALSAMPNLPPGTLPPVVLPFDPTSTVPVSLVALDSKTEPESILYDVGRYEVRNMIMSNPGASAPVVFGGKLRAVMLYLDRIKMQARGLSPVDVMRAADEFNVFVPSGDVKIGDLDFALMSNSMYEYVDGREGMGGIPLRARHGNAEYLRDVASSQDAAFIQTNVVRVNGRRQVYIPVYRQLGASTLKVVETLKETLPDMQARLTRPGIALKLVMDQSIYVRSSIEALAQEGALGSILCSLVILVFLGEWRMTLIAIMTLPLSVLAAIICLYYTGNTVNVMTLGGLALAIGPMVDSAIICLENTHRHLSLGAKPQEAAFLGASEVAMPELVATLCTFLVLAPLALMPGVGQFLFRPMALAVAFAMVTAYLLSRSLVPAFSALWLRGHGHAHGEASAEVAHAQAAPPRSALGRVFARWEALIDRGIGIYVRGLNVALNNRVLTAVLAFSFLAGVLAVLGPRLRRDFFPEVDAGAFEIFARAPAGRRIEVTEGLVAQIEEFIHQTIPEHDLELFISELGVTPDWSAAYTPNAGPMDAVIKVQLTEHRQHSSQEYIRILREGFAADPRFGQIDFAFDAGGMVRGALNEGKSTPINIRITGNDQDTVFKIGEHIRDEALQIPGVVDARVLQRMDAPAFVIEVDRAKAADLGLTQSDIMQNVIASTNSSISFNKKNFWIDPISHNQYFVGVQYPETAIESMQDVLNIPITGSNQHKQVRLGDLSQLRRGTIPSEIKHINIQPTIDVTMGVEGRDLGHVSDDLVKMLDRFGRPLENGLWDTYAPNSKKGETLAGSKIVLSGEYARMRDTFKNLALGLVLATLLMYFLMTALFKSFVTPLVILSAVPVGGIGVVLMLYVTETPVNVQSLLGVIFMVGIVVSNTVLLTDFAQHLRTEEGLSPTEAIRKAASIRVRPVVMTALAAFFALVPMAMAFERGSEANAPLGRAVIGGLLAGLVTTLFLVPALYSLVVRGKVHVEATPELPHHVGPGLAPAG
ncbi:MAG TPA: efflux RND transporter permease subunit [Pirellulales bacterium]|nr:efflux RND transporter permease subunit [Pirellulales bacterium]